MKKIKWLLLFWILTLLWIGSSFWYIYMNYQFEFKSNNNNNILFNINPWNSNISSYLMTYQDSGWTRNSVNILKKSSTTTNNLFDISSYNVSSFSPSYSYATAKMYSSSSCLDLSVTGSSYQLLFHLFWSNNCNSTSNSTIFSREVYVNVWDSCINNWVINTWNCDYWFYKYFSSKTYDSRFWQYSDNQYSWSDAWKTSISFPFPDSYSFFNSIAWSWTWPYELPSVYIINQKYVYHTWESFSALNWFYVARINDLNSTFENSDFQVIALDLHWSWTLSDLFFTYWIFDCPYSAQDILDCSFNDWWTISNLYTANSITWNVLQFLTTRDWFSVGSSYNYFSNFLRNKLSTDWTLTFYRLLSPNNATSSNYLRWLSTSVQLVSDWNNYFQDLFPWWWQSTWSIAINTWFLDLCLNNLQFWELNSYLCNKLFNWNNLVLIPGQTWYYLSYWYDENWNLRFWITYQEDLEEQMSWYIREQDENWNWYTYLPEESNTWLDNSNWLKDYFNNWFEHWVFFSCPFHYTDSYYREFKLFWITHFVPKLWQSFLYPIYCMGAWFREWKNIDFFSWVNLWLESQLLSSSDYNYLYRLFDLILSVLIMFFIIKIYHLLN